MTKNKTKLVSNHPNNFQIKRCEKKLQTKNIGRQLSLEENLFDVIELFHFVWIGLKVDFIITSLLLALFTIQFCYLSVFCAHIFSKKNKNGTSFGMEWSYAYTVYICFVVRGKRKMKRKRDTHLTKWPKNI